MKKSVNKSSLIRDLIAKNPGLGAPEILAQLSKNGTPVSIPLIYQVLRKTGVSKKSKRGRKPGSKVAKVSKVVKVAATSEHAGTEDLFAAMQAFVKAAGSLDKAIDILNVFKK